jgi:hypothetical protein
MGESINNKKKNTEALLEASGEDGIEANTAKAKYVAVSRHQNVGHHIKIWQSSTTWERQQQIEIAFTKKLQ